MAARCWLRDQVGIEAAGRFLLTTCMGGSARYRSDVLQKASQAL
jgi:hypothetical protein